MRAVAALMLVAMVLSGCTAESRAPIERFYEASLEMKGNRADSLSDHIDAAHRFAVESGVPEFGQALDRLAAAWRRPESVGGVLITIEGSRFSENAAGPANPDRVVSIRPGPFNEGHRYLLRINPSLYNGQDDGPPVLAVHLYAASLRRDWFEEAAKSGNLPGRHAVDSMIANPQGPLGAHYGTWERVLDRVYLPLRAQNKLPLMPGLDGMQNGRRTCQGADRNACVQNLIRTMLGI